jgi:5'-methylthioadenosine phosphorylase
MPDVSQTPYPEAALAAELGIDYVCVALVTDHDVIAETPWPVTQEVVTEALDRNTQRLRQALLQVATELDVAPARRAESTAF